MVEVYRNPNGFSVHGKYQTVRVEIIEIDGHREAAIYESKESPLYPSFIQAHHDDQLYRIAYGFASMSARFEFHPYG